MIVSASRYFGPFTVEFNPQTNMVIGGRGSGKSTLLEYLRWGLCDQPVNASDEEGAEEVPNYQKRRSSLIKSTLQRSHGSVTIEYLMSGVVHMIRRDADTEKIFLTIEGSPEQEVSPAVIQGLARVQGYSQKQLSNVSVRNSELLRLVTSPIKADLDALQTSDKACASELRSIFQDKEQHRALSAQRANTVTELSSKKSQIDLLTAEMKDLPADQKQAIDEHSSFTAGQRTVSSYTESVQSAVDDIDASTQRIDHLRQELTPAVGTQPNAAVTALRDSALSALETARIGLLNVRDGLTLAQTNSGKFRDEVSVGLSEHEQRYNAAASQNAAIQPRLEQIKETSSDVDSLTELLDDVDRRLIELGQVDDRFIEARERWKNLADEYFQLLTNQGSALTTASKGELKVGVSKAKDISNLVERYTQTIQGSQVTGDKIERLISTVASNADPIKEWLDIVDELLSLIEAQKVATVAIVPKMSSASIGTSELNRIATRVSATSAFELSLIRPETYPTFSYRMPDDSYIPFQDASPGQQANALLALLFGQAIGPLIIDQPEDDLDNATALQIAESIWTAKEKRQLIIASHNPNLVVIGDAELVLYCKHSKPASGGSPVGISLQGGLDMREVQDVVATVMEGGKDAFRLRMSRYGY